MKTQCICFIEGIGFSAFLLPSCSSERRTNIRNGYDGDGDCGGDGGEDHDDDGHDDYIVI